MSRSRDRVCLQDGLKLDINRLARHGVIRPGMHKGGGRQWTSTTLAVSIHAAVCCISIFGSVDTAMVVAGRIA
jgi:hypothetical protein